VPRARLLSRRVLVSVAALLISVPAMTASAAGPADVTAGVQSGLWRGTCTYADDYPPKLDYLTVCAWDAVADPETISFTGGPHRTVAVTYFKSTCTPTCVIAEGAAQVPARDVVFDPGMTAVHIHTQVGGCGIDVDTHGLEQTPSTPVGLVDPPTVYGPGSPAGDKHVQVYDYSTSGLVQYLDGVEVSACGQSSQADGWESAGYAALYLVTNEWVEADVPQGFEGVCVDAAALWYWQPTHQARCVPWS
jgi:hypothetical protein